MSTGLCEEPSVRRRRRRVGDSAEVARLRALPQQAEPVRCPWCEGKGHALRTNGWPMVCTSCHGRGTMSARVLEAIWDEQRTRGLRGTV